MVVQNLARPLQRDDSFSHIILDITLDQKSLNALNLSVCVVDPVVHTEASSIHQVIRYLLRPQKLVNVLVSLLLFQLRGDFSVPGSCHGGTRNQQRVNDAPGTIGAHPI